VLIPVSDLVFNQFYRESCRCLCAFFVRRFNGTSSVVLIILQYNTPSATNGCSDAKFGIDCILRVDTPF
jgi:hypothetical protein